MQTRDNLVVRCGNRLFVCTLGNGSVLLPLLPHLDVGNAALGLCRLAAAADCLNLSAAAMLLTLQRCIFACLQLPARCKRGSIAAQPGQGSVEAGIPTAGRLHRLFHPINRAIGFLRLLAAGCATSRRSYSRAAFPPAPSSDLCSLCRTWAMPCQFDRPSTLRLRFCFSTLAARLQGSAAAAQPFHRHLQARVSTAGPCRRLFHDAYHSLPIALPLSLLIAAGCATSRPS